MRLRPVWPSDRDESVACGRHPDVVAAHGGALAAPEPLAADAADRWYSGRVGEPLAWAMQLGGRCIGAVRLRDLDARDRRASPAIGVFAAAQRGRGLGSEAVGLVPRHAFTVLRLHRVEVRLLAGNARDPRPRQVRVRARRGGAGGVLDRPGLARRRPHGRPRRRVRPAGRH